jgi:hypothetical protein
MNNDRINDPERTGFEARLAALAPQLSQVEQQQLLYDCAFAAGKRKTERSVRRWQTTTAVIGLLLLVVIVPVATNGWRTAEQGSALAVSRPPSSSQRPVASEAIVMPEHPVAVDLDAWQLPINPDESLNEQLVQLQHADLHTRSLAVGSLTHAFLER